MKWEPLTIMKYVNNNSYLLCSYKWILCIQFNTILRILADEHPELAGRGNFIAPANRYIIAMLLKWENLKDITVYFERYKLMFLLYADLIARLPDYCCSLGIQPLLHVSPATL